MVPSQPPFAVAALSLLAALTLAVIAQAWPAAVVFGAGLAVLALVILIGLTQARAGVRTWVALLLAPWYLVWKAVIQCVPWRASSGETTITRRPRV